MRYNNGRTVFEALVVLILVCLLIIGAAAYLQRAGKITKEYAMMSELSNMRTSIMLYMTINRKFPASLRQLAEEKIIMPHYDPEAVSEIGKSSGLKIEGAETVFDKKYLEHISIDQAGNILDPFGSPYKYNASTGRVSSATTGYEAW